MEIQANGMHFQKLNALVRGSADREIFIGGCLGQRYIGAGLSEREICIRGTAGNALGAYLDGADIRVDGNAQDAVGDTMNAGRIVVNGNAGDAVGYAMRGGKIFIRGNAGYRVGIHMKQYRDKSPAIVVGGAVGSFLGEYQAGGTIMVLDLNRAPAGIVGNFCGTGMHGGEIYLRCSQPPRGLPAQVRAEKTVLSETDRAADILREYCALFGLDAAALMRSEFVRLTPDTENPYKRLYTDN